MAIIGSTTDTVSYSGSPLYISPVLQQWLDKVLLVNARPKRVYSLFADSEHDTIPTHVGQTIEFNRWMPLPPKLSPVTTAQTPGDDDIEIQKVQATVKQYMGWMKYSDVVDLTSDRNPVLTRLAKKQADQLADTEDYLTRNVVIAGASGTTCNLDLSDPDAATTTLPTALDTALRGLITEDAERIDGLIKASTGVGTEPIAPAYFAIGHTDLLRWLEAHSKWVPVHKYPNQGPVRLAEYGSINGIRFLLTTHGDATYNSGSAGAPAATDVYKIVIFGQHAYANTRLTAGNVSSIVKPLGFNNPLNQWGSIGWKIFRTSEILDDRFMYRITCTVVA
jgi:N4-gp56 family major capsid protein